MLVLDRTAEPCHSKVNVYLPNGDMIQIVVWEVRGKHVKIGIDAPLNCNICRDELVRIETVTGYPDGLQDAAGYLPRPKLAIGDLSPTQVAELSVA